MNNYNSFNILYNKFNLKKLNELKMKNKCG